MAIHNFAPCAGELPFSIRRLHVRETCFPVYAYASPIRSKLNRSLSEAGTTKALPDLVSNQAALLYQHNSNDIARLSVQPTIRRKQGFAKLFQGTQSIVEIRDFNSTVQMR